MSKVCLRGICGDEFNKIAKEIDKATNSIIYTLEKKVDKDVVDNIYEVCHFWTQDTYVGRRKEFKVQNAFQNFFENFMKLILDIRDGNIKCDEECRNAFSSLLYTGVVYRKLGHGDLENCEDEIIPEYNNIYVSWNKEKDYAYFDSKLYGPMTILTAEIKEPYFGIDLEELGVCTGQEKEVVFPTIKESVLKVEFRNE